MDPKISNLLKNRLQERFRKEEVEKLSAILERMDEKLSRKDGVDLSGKADFDTLFFRLNAFLESGICSYLFLKIVDPDGVQNPDIEKLSERGLALYGLFADSSPSPSIHDGIEPFHPYVLCLRASCRYLEAINRPLSKVNPTVSLINDIFETIFRKVSGFCQMLTLGLYPDAFVAWRTLHESEGIVSLLVNGGEEVRQSYVRHIAYNNAYRNQEEFTKEELDNMVLEIKAEMREHGLKAKDMKKFIEYGWLYSHPLYDPEDVSFKLNFRDGVEKLSGLSRYSKVYEGASEIAHSSSAFFYVNNAFCRDLSLDMVYQTYLRIADLFATYMHVYFEFHPDQKEKSDFFLEDVKALSKVLAEKVGTIKEIEDAEKED